MGRSSANKLNKYKAKIDGNIIGGRYDATKDQAVRKQTKYFGRAEALENKVKSLLSGISSMYHHFYIAFAEELLKVPTLAERDIVLKKWRTRGLSYGMLWKIRQALSPDQFIYIEDFEEIGDWFASFTSLSITLSKAHVKQGTYCFDVETRSNPGAVSKYGTIMNKNYNGSWLGHNENSVLSLWVYIVDNTIVNGIDFKFGDVVSGGVQVCKSKSFGGLQNGWNYLSVAIKDMGTFGGYVIDYNNIKQLRILDNWIDGIPDQTYNIFYDDWKIRKG